MSKILAIDLDKCKSVTCLLDTETNETEYWTMFADRQYLLTVLKKYHPDLVVIESCSISGWVHDACVAMGYKVLVCNPNQEAWKWRNVKREPMTTAIDRLDKRAMAIKKGLEEMGETQRDAAQEKLERVVEKASEYGEQRRDKVHGVACDCERFIRERPLRSVLMAAGIGWLRGRF